MTLRNLCIVVAGLLAAAPGLAHEFDLRVRALDGQRLQGQLTYSDGSPSSEHFILVADLTDPGMSEMALQTGADGSFLVPGLAGHRYAISAEGDEGHATTVEIVLAGHTQEQDGTSGWPPIYLIIGALMLLSLLPARWLRKPE